MLLTQQGARQPRQLHLLAALLGGYMVAAWALSERIAAAVGSKVGCSSNLAEQAGQVLVALKALGVDYQEVLFGAQLKPQQVQQVASWRVTAAPASEKAALLLPYPLLSSSSSTTSSSSNSTLKSMPELLLDHATKVLYSAQGANGVCEFIKFTSTPYPKHVSHTLPRVHTAQSAFTCVMSSKASFAEAVMQQCQCQCSHGQHCNTFI
jgi:hypothetical protein